MSAQRVVLQLQRDALLPLRGLHGATICCLEGALWVTHDADPNDVVLQPGQACALGRGATVQAFEASRMSLEAPQGAGHQSWVSRAVLRPA